MSKVTLTKNIRIDSCTEDKVLGVLTITTSAPITIDAIKGALFLETRGKLSSTKKNISYFNISSAISIEKGEVKELPFQVDISDLTLHSYTGKNANITYSCLASLHFSEEEFDKIDRSFFAEITSFFKSKKVLNESVYFEHHANLSSYKVVEDNYTFKLSINWLIIIGLAILLGALGYMYLPDFNMFYVVLGVFLVIALNFMIKRYIANSYGKITMRTSNEDTTTFLCTINKTKNFNLKEQLMYYQIIEKVVDRRGTSTSTYYETLYTSEEKEIPKRMSRPEIQFTYPNKAGLQTLNQGDISIIWRMNIEGVSSIGLKYKYKTDFIVR